MLILIHMNTHTHKQEKRKEGREEGKGRREGGGKKGAGEREKRKERTGMGERLMRFIDFEQSEINKFYSKSQYTNSVLRQSIKVLYPMSGVLLILCDASLRR